MTARREFIRDSFLLLGGMLSGSLLPQNDCILVANIPAFEMNVYKNGRNFKKYKISVGMPDDPTPLGDYRILTKANWENQFGGTWMRFKRNVYRGREQGGWGIHGSPCRELVGYAITRGCIRMTPEDAEELKKTVRIGTPLRNTYDLVELEDGLVVLRTDIYSRAENPERNLIRKLGIPEKFINRTFLTRVLEESDKNRMVYVKTLEELYNNYIKPLPENRGHPNLVREHPEIKTYLKRMSAHEKIVFEWGEMVS